MLKNKFISFLLFGLITYSASLIGGLITVTLKDPWYSSLIKPSFNPPSWIFAPVWTTLYLMMTVAIWLFWHSKKRDMNTVYIYFIHIIFNTTWSIIFFGLHNIFLALLTLLLLSLSISFWFVVVVVVVVFSVTNDAIVSLLSSIITQFKL